MGEAEVMASVEEWLLDGAGTKESKKYDVFLSCCRSDVVFADYVADRLILEGMSVYVERLDATGSSLLLRSLCTCCVFVPVISLDAMRQLCAAQPMQVDWFLVELLLALHFRSRVYPLIVGEKSTLGESSFDVLWHNSDFKRLRQSMPDFVPLACMQAVSAMLAVEDPPQQLAPGLATMSVRDVMDLSVGQSAAEPSLCGILCYDSFTLAGRQMDLGTMLTGGMVANVRRMLRARDV